MGDAEGQQVTGLEPGGADHGVLVLHLHDRDPAAARDRQALVVGRVPLAHAHDGQPRLGGGQHMRPHLQRRAQLALDPVERRALPVEAVVVGDVGAAAQQDPGLGGDEFAADHVEPLAAAHGEDGVSDAQVLDGLLQRAQIVADLVGGLEPALVSGDPGQLDAGRHLHVGGQLQQLLDRPAPGSAALVAQLDQHPERPRPGVTRQDVDPGRRVGEAQELELGIALQLVGGPGEPRGIDHLVGHHDPPDPEPPDRLGLPGRRHGEPPGSRGELHRGDLGRHVRLGVGRQLHAVIAGERRHRGHVVRQRAPVDQHGGKFEPAVEDRLAEVRRHNTPFVRVRPYPTARALRAGAPARGWPR